MPCKKMSLKNKKVLVTAGPTWVPIDAVRVISNISSGTTGILIAREAKKKGARVTLFLGPVTAVFRDSRIRVVPFRFFKELRSKIKKELKRVSYDFIIHAAAVSDFCPRQVIKNKAGSSKPLNLKLVPLPKIIGDIRRLAGEAKVIIFKLEAGKDREALINKAKAALLKSGADMAVANCLDPYRAYIIKRNGSVSFVSSKEVLSRRLLQELSFE
ncbi:MAG: phosphopantothenoylcysteine decarboxylase [Candidatus Omnitrophota bacterium]